MDSVKNKFRALVCVVVGGAMSCLSTQTWAQESDLPDTNQQTTAVVHDIESMSKQILAAQPEWVQKGNYVADDGTQFVVVEGDPVFEALNGEPAMREKMESRVADVIDAWIRPDAGNLLAFDWRYIDEHLRVKDKTQQIEIEYPLSVSDEKYNKMFINYTQLKLDSDFRAEVEERWEVLETRSRLKQTGLIGGGVLLLLFVVFGFFRADNASRGFYTRRLFLITFLIAAGIAAGWLYLSGQFYWL